MDDPSVAGMAEVEPWSCQPQGYLLPQPGRDGEGTGLTRTLGDFAAERGAQLSPQVSRSRSLPLGTVLISLPAGLHGAGGEGASFWRSPWQLDLVASPQKMVCFQSPWTSWQHGAHPKTAICCCQGTRNRSLSCSKQMGWHTACVPAQSCLFTRLQGYQAAG